MDPSGIYRELVRPRLSGEDQDRMIAYEAAPGEQAIIRGSRVITTKWEISADPNSSPRPSGASGRKAEKPVPTGGIYSKQIWMTTLPDSLFENGYYPFQTPNLTNQEFDVMYWALRWKGRIPYTLPRRFALPGRPTHGAIGGLRGPRGLRRLPGSYWVEPDGKTVHIHPFEGADPNGRVFEAAVQPHILSRRRWAWPSSGLAG